MYFLVDGTGRFGFPFGEEDGESVIEFRGDKPEKGSVVEVFELEQRRSGTPIAVNWRPSHEWVRRSLAELAYQGRKDPASPVVKLTDLALVDDETRRKLSFAAKFRENETYIRASEIEAMISHFEFQTEEAERQWLADRIRAGEDPSTYHGYPVRYRQEVSMGVLEAIAEQAFVKDLTGRITKLTAEHESLQNSMRLAEQALEKATGRREETEAELAELKLQLTTAEANVKAMHAQVDRVEAQKAGLENEIKDAEATLTALKESKLDLEVEQRDRRAKLLDENKELEAENRELKAKVEEARRRARDRNDEEDERVPRLRERLELMNEIDTIGQLHQALDSRIGFDALVGLHVAMKHFPFVVLTGPSGTGKSSLLRMYGEALGFYTELIAVQPSWTSAADLHGYVHPLGDPRHYVTTPFAQALGMQVDEEEFLSLVILDEINLAQVEFYLADYLSAFEGDRLVDLAMKSDLENAKVPEWLKAGRGRVRVPETFLLAGTANEDHTTRAFSDKFRDRMASIPLPAQEFEFGPTSTAHSAQAPVELGRVTPETWMRWRALPPVANPEGHDKAREVANKILKALRDAGLTFGWRQIRDVNNFVTAADPLLGLMHDKQDERAKIAFDMALEMRVLQKCTPLLGALRDLNPKSHVKALKDVGSAIQSDREHFTRVSDWLEGMNARAR